ncbi:shikimate dehydrogenase [Gillisia sp. M10.2A]|uniref:Shikimate dehydrogenase n=1 Tax=Gillisia lutea TaxID=2909668 RepID=A0ABS9EIP0_9FLAO|nr:shikimate dehydrogenase [Gillisia lutea]MCF4101343.1 shikimate dehydrogenase [Gillisia lutea]
MNIFGLIGKNIDYSFSRNYFNNKFKAEGISATYKNFDLSDIQEFPDIFKNTSEIKGLNVTIPYKKEIISYLDHLDPIAREIGAVNTIKINDDKSLTGYNTDYYGFLGALKPYLRSHHTKALILGTGGASKAVAYALKLLNIPFKFVSRTPSPEIYSYPSLSQQHLEDYQLIINCTPLGTHPQTSQYPPIPVEFLNSHHLIFDLIYNPATTRLMQLGLNNKATALNGYRMLQLQAEKAWEIWNS